MREFYDFFRLKVSSKIDNIYDVENINKDLIEFTHFKIVPLNGENNHLKNELNDYKNLDFNFVCVKFYNNSNVVSEQLRTYGWCENFNLHTKYDINLLFYPELVDY